jgi:hypothetical protein
MRKRRTRGGSDDRGHIGSTRYRFLLAVIRFSYAGGRATKRVTLLPADRCGAAFGPKAAVDELVYIAAKCPSELIDCDLEVLYQLLPLRQFAHDRGLKIPRIAAKRRCPEALAAAQSL